MKGSFSKLLIIFGVFTIFAKLALAMEDESTALQNTYAKNLFFDQEKGGEFRLERNLPTIIFAAYFIDGTSLQQQITTSFNNTATISKNQVDNIAKQIIKTNITYVIGILTFLGINFCASGLNAMIETYWFRYAVEQTIYWADILVVFQYFANKYMLKAERSSII